MRQLTGRLIKGVIGLLVLAGIWWLIPYRVQAAADQVKIIPTYFGQNDSAKDWFVYQVNPGESIRIKATLINLTQTNLEAEFGVLAGDALQGDNESFRTTDWLDPFGRPVSWQEVKLAAGSRRLVDITLITQPTDPVRQYTGWLVVKQAEKLLGASRLRVKLGQDLAAGFKLEQLEMIPAGEGVELSFELVNQGQVSLQPIKVEVGYQNNWWLSNWQEEVFVLQSGLDPGKRLKVKRLLPPVDGLIGPVVGQVVVKADSVTQQARTGFFWLAWRRLILLVGYLLALVVGVVVALKYVFKGMAGILLTQIKAKLRRSRATHKQSPTQDEPDEAPLTDLLKDSQLDYNRLLLDIRQIIREEIDLNRRLIKAELGQEAAAMMVNLIKQGVLKLDLDPQVKKKLKAGKS